ncbi:MAG: hypothetical protein QOH05_3941 [Acetobacteraceae bacterium]|jgi:hypothetical protein|nr:hypothetical protein [Acetobacteraceae bacterium]
MAVAYDLFDRVNSGHLYVLQPSKRAASRTDTLRMLADASRIVFGSLGVAALVMIFLTVI